MPSAGPAAGRSRNESSGIHEQYGRRGSDTIGAVFRQLLRTRVYPKLLRDRAWKLEGTAGVEAVGHRAYIGGRWEENGQLEFDFMVDRGLRPEHVLLDIACGSLRAGVRFIPFLERGHYLGIEKERSLVRRGLSKELPDQVRREKRPELVVSGDFEFEKFSRQADYSLAWSLFTHLNVADLETCLRNLRAYASPGHELFATFFPGPSDQNAPRSHAHASFYYEPDQLAEIGAHHGWSCNYIGQVRPGHTGKQQMMQFIGQ